MNRYSIVIEWSDDDHCFLAWSPEWADQVATPIGEGATLVEVVQSAEDGIESLIMWAQRDGKPLPTPRIYAPATA